MQTIERPVHENRAPVTTHRPWWVLALVAVLALVLGALGGWMARGSEDDPAAVVAGGGDVSDRQEQIVTTIDEYIAAWQVSDGAAVAAFYTENGRFIAMGDDLAVSSAEFTAYVDNGSFSSLAVREPVLLEGDLALVVHELAGAPYVSVLQFTSTGEPQLVSHTILPIL